MVRATFQLNHSCGFSQPSFEHMHLCGDNVKEQEDEKGNNEIHMNHLRCWFCKERERERFYRMVVSDAKPCENKEDKTHH